MAPVMTMAIRAVSLTGLAIVFLRFVDMLCIISGANILYIINGVCLCVNKYFVLFVLSGS